MRIIQTNALSIDVHSPFECGWDDNEGLRSFAVRFYPSTIWPPVKRSRWPNTDEMMRLLSRDRPLYEHLRVGPVTFTREHP